MLVRITNRASGSTRRKAAVAAMPSICGMIKSISTTSGASAGARRKASAPLPASPTRCRPASASIIAARPMRIIG